MVRLCPILALCLAFSTLGGRIVSVPDLHGDFERTVTILKDAKLIDDNLHWIGGDTKLVQTGDIVDRGPDCKRIFELFFELSDEAAKSGGEVINLLGNHEVMNIRGDLRYVNEADVQKFGGEEERTKAFEPSGWLGSKLRTFPVAAVVGKVLFVHAGILPEILHHRSLQDFNSAFHTALAASDRDELIGSKGPVWARQYATNPSAGTCNLAEDVLRELGAVRMVVGHTIQKDYHVHTQCDGRVVLGDTAVSSVYGGSMSFMEHDGEGNVKITYPGTSVSEVLLPLPSATEAKLPSANFLEIDRSLALLPSSSLPSYLYLPCGVLAVASALLLYTWSCGGQKSRTT